MWIEVTIDVDGFWRKSKINKYHISFFYNDREDDVIELSSGKKLYVKESYDEITKLLEGENDAKCE